MPDLASLPVFSTVHLRDLPFVLGMGLLSPSTLRHYPNIVQLQEESYARELLTKSIRVSDELHPIGDFAHLRFLTLTPTNLMIATGHSKVQRRQNSELVHVRAEPAVLKQLGIVHYYVDRTLLSPMLTASADPTSIEVDVEFLLTRNFRASRNAEFGAGIVIPGVLPPQCISSLVCADDATRDRVADQVRPSRLPISVIADRKAFFPQQGPGGDAPAP